MDFLSMSQGSDNNIHIFVERPVLDIVIVRLNKFL